ncbi:uncharacterized protein LOC121250645 [Juglans microcarpa x Juglans regia]|uniref:uncharacterized protein LOC121250645 n=1 Tax=Juglans microcarpa x Juglans regia TaxID=2249226 RepID=UPI001B7DD12E|nr:uncharacterized protein LOC121250645 [Juglans microcarpa x Juglans regia]
MGHPLSFILFHLLPVMILFTAQLTLAPDPVCKGTCGSVQVKYPFGTGTGCGSPRFQPYVTCKSDEDQLVFTTHTGSYPITSISYTTSTLIISPSDMSTCISMRQCSSSLGVDWASPFQLGPSTFILISCTPPTSSLTLKGTPICDPSYSHLCASLYTCPAVVSLGLPLFPPTNSCCVYSPANLNGKGELDLRKLKCEGYASVLSLGMYPTDPSQWQYGVALKYVNGVLDNNIIDTKCNACEMSGGVCGYAPPSNSFVCICKNGYNTSMDCNNNYGQGQLGIFWSTASLPTGEIWFGFLAGLIFCLFT